MPDILNSKPGTVSIMPLPDAVVPAAIKIGEFAPKAGLVSGVDHHQQTNQQFQTSLDGSIFVYQFGDHMGDTEVHGVCFPALCGGGTEGLREVLDFYDQNRSSATGATIVVQLGSYPITGFVTGLRVFKQSVGDDPSSFSHRFVITVSALPKKA